MKQHKGILAATVLLFFLMMLFPIWGNLLPQTGVEGMNENRELTEWPEGGSLKNRIAVITNYFEDRLAFREQAIAALARMDIALGQSPVDRVMIGLNGWLFYDEEGYSREDIRRTGTLGESLDYIAEEQKRTAETLKAAGADYRIVIAPDKHTIYPQYLPMNCRQGSGPSHLDEIYETLDREQAARYVDLRPDLIRESGTSNLYYPTDTHWNSAGAWVAYQTLMDALQPEHPGLRRLTEADVERVEATASGDLAAMIGVAGEWIDHYTAVLVKESAAREDSFNGMDSWVNDAVPDGPHVLLLHDSFGPELIPFLKESVHRLTVGSNENFSLSAIGDPAQYDIILAEYVERNALWLTGGLTEESEDEDGGEWDEDDWE